MMDYVIILGKYAHTNTEQFKTMDIISNIVNWLYSIVHGNV